MTTQPLTRERTYAWTDPAQTAAILDLIARHDLALHPVRAIHPVVTQHDPDWRNYYGALNVPNISGMSSVWQAPHLPPSAGEPQSSW